MYYVCLGFFLLYSSLALSETSPEYDLDALLLPVGESVDIAKLSNAMPIPGVHSLLVKLNGRKIHNDDFTFIADRSSSELCVSVNNMVKVGVNTKKLGRDSFSNGCFTRYGNEVFFQFDADKYSVDFFVSSYFMLSEHEKNIKNIDDGISGLRLNYSYLDYSDLSDITSHGRLKFDSIASLGAWRLAGSSYLKRNIDGGGSFEQQQAYAYRHMVDFGSYFSFGKFVSNSSSLGSLMFTGFEYSTDRRLRKKTGVNTSLTSYYAKKDALLTLKQDGVVIDEQLIHKGFFELPISKVRSSSELEVNLDYGGNQTELFFVPLYQPINVLRKGEYDFSFHAGEMSDLQNKPFFIGGDLSYGLYNNLTLNGGARLGEETKTLSFSTDYTSGQGRVSVGGIYDNPRKESDNLARFLTYSREVESLGLFFSAKTAFNNAGGNVDGKPNHYDSQGISISSRKSLLNSTASASLERRAYDNGKKTSSLGVSVSGRYNDISHNLSYRFIDDDHGKTENYFGMSFSIPIDINQHGYNIGLKRVHSSGSISTTGLDIAGDLSDDVRISADVSMYDSGELDTKNINLNHYSRFSNTLVGYSSNKDSDYLSLNVSGQLAYTEHGVVSSGDTSRTSFLVHVPNVEGVGFNESRGVRTNADGYALIRALPFDKSSLTIRPNTISDDVDIPNTITSGVASEGAILYRKIDAIKGKPYLIKVTNDDALNIPFGADVLIDDMETNSITSSGGNIFISVLPVKANKVSVLWEGGRCDVSLQSADVEEKSDITILKSLCVKPKGELFAISKTTLQY